jgi:hypothetical protein
MSTNLLWIHHVGDTKLRNKSSQAIKAHVARGVQLPKKGKFVLANPRTIAASIRLKGNQRSCQKTRGTLSANQHATETDFPNQADIAILQRSVLDSHRRHHFSELPQELFGMRSHVFDECEYGLPGPPILPMCVTCNTF